MNELLNVDCMEYMKTVGGGTIDLTLTDIPYEMNNARMKNTLRVDALRDIGKGKADILTFQLNDFLKEVYRITKGTIIIFCAISQVSPIYSFFKEKQIKSEGTVRQLIWEKTNPSPMNGQFVYLSGIENAIYFRKSGGTFNAMCKNTVFKYPIGNSKIHPTEKNHALLRELIRDNSNEGDLIFDACAGSGSTLLVARQMGRNFIGCEIDKEYFEKANKRLLQETSQMSIYDFM